MDFALANDLELDGSRAARAVAAGRSEELWTQRLRGTRSRRRDAYFAAVERKLTSAVISLGFSVCPKFDGITPAL